MLLFTETKLSLNTINLVILSEYFQPSKDYIIPYAKLTSRQQKGVFPSGTALEKWFSIEKRCVTQCASHDLIIFGELFHSRFNITFTSLQVLVFAIIGAVLPHRHIT